MLEEQTYPNTHLEKLKELILLPTHHLSITKDIIRDNFFLLMDDFPTHLIQETLLDQQQTRVGVVVVLLVVEWERVLMPRSYFMAL